MLRQVIITCLLLAISAGIANLLTKSLNTLAAANYCEFHLPAKFCNKEFQ